MPCWPVSLAVTLAAADASGEPLWRMLNDGAEPMLPLPMVNIVSGGAHAGGMLDIQDVLAVPFAATSFAQALEWAWRIRASTADLLDARGGSSTLVADEGGLAEALGSNEAALALVTDGIVRAGFRPGTEVGIAVDLAANQLYHQGSYRLRVDDRTLDAAEWLDRVAGWCDRYPIVSIEDVLAGDDWAAWRTATERLGAGRQLIGDDLFATATLHTDSSHLRGPPVPVNPPGLDQRPRLNRITEACRLTPQNPR